MSQVLDQHEIPDMEGDKEISKCEEEPENDTGYSSYDSSCPLEEESDKSWVLPVSCGTSSQENSPDQMSKHWCYNEDDSMQGVDEVDDLLFHFERFFHEKLEHHMREFSSSMQSMFTEQQIHVRQIVNSVYGEGYQDSDLLPESEEQDLLNPTGSGQDQKGSIEALPTDVRSPLLLELLSLSCEVSSLLHQDKYRS